MGLLATLTSGNPLVSAGVGVGMSALNKIMGFGGGGGFDPTKHKKDILMSKNQEHLMREQGKANVSEQTMGALGAMKQYGAANKLPVGAITSGIQGITGKAGESAGKIELGIENQKHQRMMSYLNMLKESQNRESDNQFGRYDFTPEIGSLTKSMMLYQSGMMDYKPEDFGQPSSELAG